MSASTLAQDGTTLTSDDEAALYGIPVVTSVGGSLLLVAFANESKVGGIVVAVMPLITAATTCGVGRIADVAGSCKNAFLGATLGAAAGLALIGGGILLEPDIFGDGDLGFALIIVGAATYLLVPAFAAIRGYRWNVHAELMPTVLSAVNGMAAPGATLRLHF